MTELIPLLQTLVWPIFILVLLFFGRKAASGILEAIRVRIDKGDTLEAGTSGFKLGPSRTPEALRPPPEKGAQPLLVNQKPEKIMAHEIREEVTASDKAKQEDRFENPGIYLVHIANRDKTLDRGEYEYYRLRILLETDPGVDLSIVTRVVYQLHPDFGEPERTVTDRGTNFELRTAAWGQFNMTADVYFDGRKEPMQLERYINF